MITMQGRGRVKDGRKRGQKNPYFLTKLVILLFLMTGDKRRREIRDHLRKLFGIVDSSGIDRQLLELVQAGYIEKSGIEEYDGIGIKPVSYGISGKFKSLDGLRELHELFTKVGKDLNEKGIGVDWEFGVVSTPYCQSLLEDGMFPEVSRYFLRSMSYKATEKMLLSDDERLADPLLSSLSQLANSSIENQRLLGKIAEMLKDKELRNQVNVVLEQNFAREEYPERRKEIAEAIADAESQILMSGESPLPSANYYIPEFFFPMEERPEILGIVRSSPSALDLLLSLGRPDSRIVEQMMAVYLLPFWKLVLEFLGNVPREVSEEQMLAVDTLLEETIPKWRAVSHAPTPMLLILRSMFVKDIFSSRLVKTEWSSKYASDLLKIRDFSYEDLRNKFQRILEKPVDRRES
jgi:hypothetical protein